MEQHFSPDHTTSKIEGRTCLTCKAQMVLARVTPARLGFNSLTFECVRCACVEKVIETADPIQSDVLGWLLGELRPPT